MFTTEQMQNLVDNDGVVVDRDGDKVGKITEVFLDDQSGRPEWVTAKTGLFGGADTFVPLADAKEEENAVRVAHDKATIKDAPRTEAAEGHLSPEQERELYQHYGLQAGDGDHESDRHHRGHDGEHADPGGQQRDHDEDHRDHNDMVGTSQSRDRDGDHGLRDGDHGERDRQRDHDGPDGDGSMVRSEERVDVDKERVQTGKARLRKYVVTENVTTTVPVEREEVRVERESIDPDDADSTVQPDGEIGEDEQDVVLTEEQVTVNKETVPVEKVSVGTDTVTEDREVTEEVRKEQIDSDVDTGEPGRDR